MEKLTQLLNPSAMKFQCPDCKSEIPYFDVKIGFGDRWTREQFQCLACKSLLCVSAVYSWSVFVGTLLAAVAISLLIGIHPWSFLLIVTMCIWFFLGMLAGAYVKILFPPKILQYYPNDLSFKFGRKD